MRYETILYSYSNGVNYETGIIYESILFGTEITIPDNIVSDFEEIKDEAIADIEAVSDAAIVAINAVANGGTTHIDTVEMVTSMVNYYPLQGGVLKSVTGGTLSRNGIALNIGDSIVLGDIISIDGTQGINCVITINKQNTTFTAVPSVGGEEIQYQNVQAMIWVPQLNDYVMSINSIVGIKTSGSIKIIYRLGSYIINNMYSLQYILEGDFLYIVSLTSLIKYNLITNTYSEISGSTNVTGIFIKDNIIILSCISSGIKIIDKTLFITMFSGITTQFRENIIVNNYAIQVKQGTASHENISLSNYSIRTFSTIGTPTRLYKIDETFIIICNSLGVSKYEASTNAIAGNIATTGSVNFACEYNGFIYALTASGYLYKINYTNWTVESGYPKTGYTTCIDGVLVGSKIYALSNVKELQSISLLNDSILKTTAIPSTNNYLQGRLYYDNVNNKLAVMPTSQTYPTYTALYKISDL